MGLLNCGQIVIAIEALSLAHSINLPSLLLLHTGICAMILGLRLKPIDLLSVASPLVVLKRFFRNLDLPLKGMLVVVVLCGLITLVLAIAVPPNNYDSMTYHLARVGFYLQQGSLDAFATPDLRQTSFPANAEILVLWQTVLLLNDRMAGLVQWLSWCGCILAVYSIARRLGFAFRAAVFGSLAVGSFPAMVLQSTSTQNDLITTFFLICSFVFLGVAPGDRVVRSEVLLAALGLSLAIGTKPTSAFMFPGAALYAVMVWAAAGSLNLRKLGAFIALCLMAFFLFGSYFYIQNARVYGTPFGPPAIRIITNAQRFEWEIAWSNFGRLLLHLLNPSGTISPSVCVNEAAVHFYTALVENASRYLRISHVSPARDFVGKIAPAGHEDLSSFGVLFGYFGVPILFVSLLAPKAPWLDPASRWLALASLSYWILISMFLSCNVYVIRFMIPTAVVGAPLLARLYLSSGGTSSAIWNGSLVTLCASSIGLCALMNDSKPIMGPRSVVGKDRLELMVGPSFLTGFRFINSLEIKGLRLGVVSSLNDRTYPLFGAHFERVVIPIRIDRQELLDPEKLPDVDCLLFYSNRQLYFPTGPAAQPWFEMDLRPLLRQLQETQTRWEAVYHSSGFGDLFAREPHIASIRTVASSFGATEAANSSVGLEAAALIAPSGEIVTATPTYTWSAAAKASWYYLWVNDSKTGSGKIKIWLTAGQAGCASGLGTCSLRLNIPLATGPGLWQVQTWNEAGFGPWSTSLAFKIVGGDPPAKVALVSPSGEISKRKPAYSWKAVSNADWYQLWVDDSGRSPRILSWYTAQQAGCASGAGTCSVAPAIELAPGGGKWWIQAMNSDGIGPTSDGMSFSVGSGRSRK